MILCVETSRLTLSAKVEKVHYVLTDTGSQQEDGAFRRNPNFSRSNFLLPQNS